LFTEAIWAVKVLANDLETEPKFRSMRRLENVKINFTMAPTIGQSL